MSLLQPDPVLTRQGAAPAQACGDHLLPGRWTLSNITGSDASKAMSGWRLPSLRVEDVVNVQFVPVSDRLDLCMVSTRRERGTTVSCR